MILLILEVDVQLHFKISGKSLVTRDKEKIQQTEKCEYIGD